MTATTANMNELETVQSYINDIYDGWGSVTTYVSDRESFDNYLRRKVNYATAQDIISKLSKCQCCHRHCQNKPISVNDEDCIAFKGQNDTDCRCRCRNSSRWLQRVHRVYHMQSPDNHDCP